MKRSVGGGGVWPLARPPDRPSWEEALCDLSARLWFRAAVPGLGCLRGPSWVRVDPREHPAVPGTSPEGSQSIVPKATAWCSLAARPHTPRLGMGTCGVPVGTRLVRDDAEDGGSHVKAKYGFFFFLIIIFLFLL